MNRWNLWWGRAAAWKGPEASDPGACPGILENPKNLEYPTAFPKNSSGSSGPKALLIPWEDFPAFDPTLDEEFLLKSALNHPRGLIPETSGNPFSNPGNEG